MVLLKNPSQDRKGPGQTIIVKNCNILLKGELRKRSLLLQNGKIGKIAANVSAPYDHRIEARNLLAIPGLVDAHVHLRDMGLSYKENFTTGTSAAAAGGVTTVLDMPNTIPPTDSKRRLEEKIDRAKKATLVNVGFHAAAVFDETTIEELHRAGAFSLKLYLPNPISPLAVGDDTVLSRLMRSAAKNRLPLTIHAEDQTSISTPKETIRSFQELAATRTTTSETRAVSRILRIRKLAPCQVHFCHLTLHSSLRMIRNSRLRDVSSEVTPHHLLLSSKSLIKKKWKAWMVPPLRSEIERKRLFLATAKGDTVTIGSDHAPHTVKEKWTSPSRSPPGVPGLETTLPLLLTLVNRGMITLSRMQSLVSVNPARVFGLASKGRLEPGCDADIVLVDMKKKSKIDPEAFHSKAKYSPFEGTETQGSVHTTILAGTIVYTEGQIIAKPGSGKVLVKV